MPPSHLLLLLLCYTAPQAGKDPPPPQAGFTRDSPVYGLTSQKRPSGAAHTTRAGLIYAPLKKGKKKAPSFQFLPSCAGSRRRRRWRRRKKNAAIPSEVLRELGASLGEHQRGEERRGELSEKTERAGVLLHTLHSSPPPPPTPPIPPPPPTISSSPLPPRIFPPPLAPTVNKAANLNTCGTQSLKPEKGQSRSGCPFCGGNCLPCPPRYTWSEKQTTN